MTFREVIEMLPDAPVWHAPQSAEGWQFRCEMKSGSGLVNERGRRALATFKPEEAKKKHSLTDAAIKHAKRVEDWPLLERAVDEKIADLQAFVAWWQASVTPRQSPGRGGNKSGAERGPI